MKSTFLHVTIFFLCHPVYASPARKSNTLKGRVRRIGRLGQFVTRRSKKDVKRPSAETGNNILRAEGGFPDVYY